MPNAERDTLPIEAPPFLRTWPRVYAAVLCYLAALLAVLYILTKVFEY